MVSQAAPIPTRQPVKIYINWGQARGKKQIEASLNAAILRALKRAMDLTIEIMKKVVPQSEFRDPPYDPVWYKSEDLLGKAVIILEESFSKMKAGSGLKKRYYLKYGYPASYAEWVNRMRNVKHWSKKGTGAGFFGKAKVVLHREFRKALKFELARPRAKQLELAKYIGTVVLD